VHRELLRDWLERGLSLNEIGALTNRDPSTVSYWLRKHGLVANGHDKHAPVGPLTREQLKPLVEEGKTVAEIADALGRKPTAVRYWLGKLGMRTKSRRGPRPMVSRARVEQAIKEGARTVNGRCHHHGDGVFVIENSGRVRCRGCRMERVSARRRKVKRMLIEDARGRCEICSYDRFVGALHFHHLDPSIKRFAVSRNGATLGIDVLRAEAWKCVVLCANATPRSSMA
jgi:hypothetical protein